MNKEIISDKQGIVLVFLYIIGEAAIFVMGLEAGRDIWLAIILSIFMALPIVFVYIRLHHIFPQDNLFDMIERCFGRISGKVIILIFVYYSALLVESALIDFSQFTTTVTIVETPPIIITIMFGFLSAWLVKEGIEVMGKISNLYFILISMIIFFVTLLLISQMNMENILPILSKGIKPIVKGAYSIFAFPFGEIVIFTMVFSTFKTKKSPIKIYVSGLLLGGAALLIISVSNILVLGVDKASSLYYPSYASVSRIDLGQIFQRVEVVVAALFIQGGIIKLGITLLAAATGIQKLFNMKDYRVIVMPTILLIINLTYFDFDSVMHYHEFGFSVYPYYAFIFQVILPVIILIAAEIKKKRLTHEHSK